MGLKFYAYKHSTAAMIVSMVLRMKKIPYDYIEVDLGKGEHKKPDYLAIQPFGLVPSIVSVVTRYSNRI
jgi:glutathione S-transferase